MLLLIVLVCVAGASEISYAIYSNDSRLLKDVKLTTEVDEIHFYLFNRDMYNNRYELKINDTKALIKSSFNVNQTTKVIVHGWMTSDDTKLAVENLKNAFLRSTDFNIIIVDWTKLASTTYRQTTAYVNTVSILLIEFLIFMMKNGLAMKKLHLIGHCLGAHIVSNAGKYFRAQKMIIDAITALDPAYPLFKFKAEEELPHISDASYVEVVHTNSESWGFRSPLGHVDFYPNGGKWQPGCDDTRGICAHNRALMYYAESITSKVPFTAIYCETWDTVYYHKDKRLNMSGVHLNYGADGIYFFLTMPESPFPLGSPDDWQALKDEHIARFVK